MGIKDWLATRWGYTKQEAAKADRGGVQWVFSGEAPLAQPGWADLDDVQRERLATTSAWVYSDIQELTKLAVQSNLDVYHHEGEEEVAEYDHEFERLLRRPNPHMGRRFLMQYTLWWWLLRGEAYWLLAEDRAGEMAAMYPLPASRMEPIPHPTEYVAGYRYYPKWGAEPKIFSREQIFFLRFPNPFDYHRGLSPLSAYNRALQTDVAAENWNLSTFTKEVSLRTLFAIKEQGGMFEAASARIQEQLETKGLRWMTVPAEHVDVKEFGLSHKDMEFLTGREFTRNEIDRVFGFPEGYWSARANRANAEQAVATVIEGTVWPLLSLFAEELTIQVVSPRYGDEYLVQPEDIRPRKRQLEVAERKTYWPVTKLNEARAELGRDEYDGPLADLLGELPVSLATNPQFVMAYAGLAPAGEFKTGGNGRRQRAALEDLRRWKSIERRRFREGHVPGSYEFVSDALPDGVMAEVKVALAGAESEEAVERAFEVDVGAVPAEAGPEVDRELIELALRAGVPGPRLWPKLGLGFGAEEMAEMEQEAYPELGKPWWEPERELGGENEGV